MFLPIGSVFDIKGYGYFIVEQCSASSVSDACNGCFFEDYDCVDMGLTQYCCRCNREDKYDVKFVKRYPIEIELISEND